MYMRKKDYPPANHLRDLLQRKGVSPDTLMAQTDWLKKYKGNSQWVGKDGWVGTDEGPIPKIHRLTIPMTSRLYAQGFVDPLPAILVKKEQDLFSDAHYILQEFFNEGITDVCTFTHDSDHSMYPELNDAM